MDYVAFSRRLGIALLAVSFAGSGLSAERSAPVNVFGASVLDGNGGHLNYSRKQMTAMETTASVKATTTSAAAAARPTVNGSFVPPNGAQTPFWQYSIFGSSIGSSNILIGPAPANGAAREIVIGGNSGSGFGSDDFWQAIRRNPVTGNYDSLFVSPLYTSPIQRIALANVVGDANLEVVVMLNDGRIFLYDFSSKTALGYINTGISGLLAMSLKDLNGDGLAEIIVTTSSNLYVFNNTGALLWQVGVGGNDVIAGQMDNDPAIEIAVTSGNVVDSATHAVQWTRSGGFGNHLKLAPFPGENYQQLIEAEAWNFVYSYDIGRQLPRWSIHTPQDIGAIEVADVDNDGVPEILIGDGQWGTVHVHDLVTQAQKWAADNPQHGVTNLAVGDVDGDGVADLLWGAGATSTGADFLYVANTTGTHNIKWQNADLEGPFLGPLIGDLDGDGKPELVVCSYFSDSTYSSGRILVFDLATLTLRGMSAPVINNRCWTGVKDLKLRDLEGDGRMEILVGGDNLYDGTMEAWGFDVTNTFTLKWTNTTRPSGSPFNCIDFTSLSPGGAPEMIAGNSVAHTGSPGVYVYMFDYPSTTNPWQSVNLASGFSMVAGMVVQDLDGNGSKEIAALVGTGDLYTFDGPSRSLRNLRQATGYTRLSSRTSAYGFIAGDSTGVAHFLTYANDTYYEPFSRELASSTFDGINETPDGYLWYASNGVLSLRVSPYKLIAWQSPAIGAGFGRFVATDVRDKDKCVFSSAKHVVAGLTYQAPDVVFDMIAIGARGNDIVVTFSAVAGKTYRLERRQSLSGAWQMVAGISDFTAPRNGPNQFVDGGGVAMGKAYYRVTELP